MQHFARVGALIGVASAVAAGAGAQTEVYANSFEGGAGAEWSRTDTTFTPNGARRFLGLLTSVEEVNLNLIELPNHDALVVEFDLFLIRTWDGNNTEFGSDVWQFGYDSNTLLNTTFSNWDQGINMFPQSYPGPLAGSFAARTGSSENNTLGFTMPIYPGGIQDSVYRLRFFFPHQQSQITLNFSADGIYDGSFFDEAWGLDNVTVTAFSAPEPSTLSFLCLFAMSGASILFKSRLRAQMAHAVFSGSTRSVKSFTEIPGIIKSIESGRNRAA